MRSLTNASGFFFERGGRLFLVTSRHVVTDAPSGHFPDRIEIERSALPAKTVYRAFTPEHLPGPQDQVEVGSSLLVVGFPLGFQDALHHMPVVRHAVIASSFGLRFQGQGYYEALGLNCAWYADILLTLTES